MADPDATPETPCEFAPEVWEERSGIDGPVLICHVHGWHADGLSGIYETMPGQVSGYCLGSARSYDGG